MFKTRPTPETAILDGPVRQGSFCKVQSGLNHLSIHILALQALDALRLNSHAIELLRSKAPVFFTMAETTNGDAPDFDHSD